MNISLGGKKGDEKYIYYVYIGYGALVTGYGGLIIW